MLRVTNDDVLALLKLVDELVELDEVMTVLVDVNDLAVVVEFGSQVDANDGVLNWLLGVNDNLVFVWLVVQSWHLGLNVNGLLFNSWHLVKGVTKIDLVLLEECHKVGEDNLLNLNCWQSNIVVLPCGERLLVVVEETNDAFVEAEEDGVANGGFVLLEN